MDRGTLRPERIGSPMHVGTRRVSVAVIAALCIAVAGCGSTSAGGGGRLRIVAAENFWGSIANQLAGTKGIGRSIIVNPAQDPHSYEPTASDARTLATAQLAIVNGIGYDGWSSKLLAANPAPSRVALDVGHTLGLHEGDNPHRWYSPADVDRIATAITSALTRLDPSDANYFQARRRSFEQRDLGQYHSEIARIRRSYGGTPVGASESIFTPLAAALGLRVLTPSSFTRAISEGSELSVQDKLAAERQVTGRKISVWIYNSQNAAPEIQRLNQLARAAAIPIVNVTETLTPASATFQEWQVRQLRELELVLARSQRK
jgi:zinc/manganese transport system substrate-binding protein